LRLRSRRPALTRRLHRPRASPAEDFVAHASTVNCVRIGRRSSGVMVTGGDDKRVNMWAIGKPHALLVRAVCAALEPAALARAARSAPMAHACAAPRRQRSRARARQPRG
jgi:hypothetical protein